MNLKTNILCSAKVVFTFAFLGFLLHSCANISAPTGGAKDTTAPLLRKRTVKDSMLNYNGGKIQFEFDEYVQIKDLQNQMVVTPLLKNKPTVTSKKNTVTIFIADSLLEKNTTYKISFGKSIQDLHEGNPSNPIEITFSTGNYFDSLSLKGTVLEAATGKVDTSMWVLLYNVLTTDSAFVKEQPLYIQKVNFGEFQFTNLPNKSFKLFALQDANNNLKYDGANEKIAFILRNINPVDTNENILLYSFLEKTNLDSNSKSRFRNAPKKPIVANKEKSLSYTISVDTLNKTKRTFGINDTLKIIFNNPILKLDKSKIRLYQEAILDETVWISLDSTNKIISLKTDWMQDATYKLELQKAFASDSIIKSLGAEFLFKTKRQSDYGILTLKHEKNENQILEILFADKIIHRKKITDTVSTFQTLNPGNYQVRILNDANGNGIWDSGTLFPEKKLPEIVELFPQEITIKANWENKIDLRKSSTKNYVKAMKSNLRTNSISADLIFDGYQFLAEDAAIEVDEVGTIISVGKKNESTIFYEGLLIPGFVNCHCHLELSFLKNIIPPKQGLVSFIQQIISQRNSYSPEFIQQEIFAAEQEMIENGIVAVGDISNGLDTVEIKKQQNLYYHTFVECFGLDENAAQQIIEKATEINNQFSKIGTSNLVLHAPYSVSSLLIEKVVNVSQNKISTIHNQETESENELFEKGTGDLRDFFEKIIPKAIVWNSNGKSSLQNYFTVFSNFKNSILVHNTFTSKEDITFAKNVDTRLFWCLCPNANLYIENRLPDVELLYNQNCEVVFGTDSLASNHTLNIFDEMMLVKNVFPSISFEKLLQSITSVGAKALAIDNKMGSFEVGKKPGINIVSNYENSVTRKIKKLF